VLTISMGVVNGVVNSLRFVTIYTRRTRADPLTFV